MVLSALQIPVADVALEALEHKGPLVPASDGEVQIAVVGGTAHFRLGRGRAAVAGPFEPEIGGCGGGLPHGFRQVAVDGDGGVGQGNQERKSILVGLAGSLSREVLRQQ